MEGSYSQCERDSGTGQVLDPIYYTPIPEDRLIVVREGNGVWCMDALVLLKNMVLFNNTTNPLTRTELSESVLRQVDEYRFRQLRVVVVVDDAESVKSSGRSHTLTFNNFDMVGDVIAQAALISGKSIVTIIPSVEGKSLYALDLERDLSRFDPLVIVRATKDALTLAEYERIKEFIGKFDRYKHKFSPFPAWINTRSTPPTDSSVQQVWVPAPYGVGNSDGTWTDWKLAPNTDTHVPSDYNGGSMPGNMVRQINTYNTTKVSSIALRKLGQAANALVSRRASLPPPVITQGVAQTPRTKDNLWVPSSGYSHPDLDVWFGWKLIPDDAWYEYPPDYDGGYMSSDAIDAIESFNKGGGKTGLMDEVRGSIVLDMVDRGEPLPFPIYIYEPHWIPTKYLGRDSIDGNLFMWDVNYSELNYTPPEYNGEKIDHQTQMDIERYSLTGKVSAVRKSQRLGSVAKAIVEDDGTLPEVTSVIGW